MNDRLMQIIENRRNTPPRPARSRYPRPVVACIRCGSTRLTITQGLGVVLGRYWRRHLCEGCRITFCSGVPAVPGTGETRDVETLPSWFSAQELRDINESGPADTPPPGEYDPLDERVDAVLNTPLSEAVADYHKHRPGNNNNDPELAPG